MSVFPVSNKVGQMLPGKMLLRQMRKKENYPKRLVKIWWVLADIEFVVSGVQSPFHVMLCYVELTRYWVKKVLQQLSKGW